ncbi:MAG: DUF1972 domain-containing protein [Bacteroidota bacterium]
MKIGILGTRGIPNYYSGFEQLAEYLSRGLVERGHEVYVYNSHNHRYQESMWNGVHLIHRYDPEYRLGTFGQFIYDLNCIRDSRKRQFDVLLQLGYTSSTIWWFLLPRSSVIATNMDGLEWKRSKYNRAVQQFLKVAEWLGVVGSDVLVADSIGIRDYLAERYGKSSAYIAYGADLFDAPDPSVLAEFDVTPHNYDMLVARMEPENNIRTILEGKIRSTSDRPFLVVGNYENTPHGRAWKQQFRDPRIRFTGGIFDIHKLNNLRHFSNLYFHGHSVGGTNPSLLEAMASSALVCAHQNPFNAAILGEDAHYFSDADSVCHALDHVVKQGKEAKIARNRDKIRDQFSWEAIINGYEAMMKDAVQQRK